MITSDREDPVPPSKSLQEEHRSRNHDERDMWPGSLPIEMRRCLGPYWQWISVRAGDRFDHVGKCVDTILGLECLLAVRRTT